MKKILTIIMLTSLAPLINADQDFYQSNYKTIQWNSKSQDTDYCLDITDENWNIYPGFQALKCGKDLLSFSPIDFVRNQMHTELPNRFAFNWRVWSRKANGETAYGGKGYEGKVVVGDFIGILVGDVFNNVNAFIAGDHKGNTIEVDNNPSWGSSNISTNPIKSRKETEQIVRNNGGINSLSTINEWCGQAQNITSCLKQTNQSIVLYEKIGFDYNLELSLLGLFPNKRSLIELDTSTNSMSIGSFEKMPSTAKTHSKDQINGNWSGYKINYDLFSSALSLSIAYANCTKQICTLSTNEGQRIVDFKVFNTPSAWNTKDTSEPAGATLSNEPNLMTMYLCRTPLDKMKAFDNCGFFSLRRD